jgi:ribosomal protein S27E
MLRELCRATGLKFGVQPMGNETASLIYNWSVECSTCGTETEVLVYNEDEAPVFCPMCGNSVITVTNGEAV